MAETDYLVIIEIGIAAAIVDTDNLVIVKPNDDIIFQTNNIVIVVKTPTPTQRNTTVGFDTKMTLHTPPHPPHHRNFSGTSRRARELKFGTDTH